MIVDILNDPRIRAFKLEYNIEDQILSNYISELSLYLKNIDKFDIQYNQGYIELVTKPEKDNFGITYLDEIYFDKAISINDVDVISNPQKGVFIKHVIASGKLENYFLTGSNGIGKTHMALALANLKYSKTNEKTLYVFWPDFIEKSKNFKSNNAQIINTVKYTKSLIIDDLGQESISQWSRDDILNPIIAFRLSKNLDTYITSNYSFDELKQLYTLKVIDRKKAKSIISKIDGLCKMYSIDGIDLRKKK